MGKNLRAARARFAQNSWVAKVERQTKTQFLIIGYILTGLVLKILIRDPWLLRRQLTRMAAAYASRVLEVLNVNVSVTGLSEELRARLTTPGSAQAEGLMIVSNHLTYLDIFVLFSVAPMMFISSVELQTTPFVGLMAELGGTLFVERRGRGKIHQDIAQIGQALRQGFNVVLFPESTSSDGRAVLPFKRSMLTAATETGASFLPLTINYWKLEGEPLTRANCDRIFWYGDMTFPPHFRKVIANKSVDVEVSFHNILKPEAPEDTKAAARQLHEIISKHFTPVV